jgi:D-xylose reductase
MEKLVDAGVVRNIGVSNFNVQSVLDLLAYCKYLPAALEIEHHPYLQQKRLIDWVRGQNIHIIAYASFGNTAFDVVPAHTRHLPNMLSHPVIQKIAAKHNRGTGQVCLAWAVQRDIIVIPKSVNVSRMESNLDIFFELDQDDLKEIEELEARARFCDHFIDTTGHEFPIFD